MKKNKHIFIILLLVFAIPCAYGINIYRSDYGISIHITDTFLKAELYEYSGDLKTTEEYNVSWEIINGIRYLSFNYNGGFLDHHKDNKISHGKKRYLVIEGEFFLLFFNENNKCEFEIEESKAPIDWSNVTTISATSELKEKNTVYSVKNLYNLSQLNPWVEGVPGDGIGEIIRIEMEQSRRRPDGVQKIISLYISNGFVDYNKPYLYEYNNRVKKIRIRNIGNGYNEYLDFNIEDSPNVNRIYFEFKNPSYIIDIEILEVYKGTKYDDTCINFLIPSATY